MAEAQLLTISRLGHGRVLYISAVSLIEGKRSWIVEEGMSIKHIIAITCIAVGIYLIASANRSQKTTGEQIRKEFTGDYSQHSRNNMIGGIVLVVLGGGLLLYRGRN